MKRKRKRGVHKNLNNQKERTKYGRLKISARWRDGLSEADHRALYNDNSKLGVLWALHKYTPKEKLFMNQIIRRIGWRIRDVKNGLQDLMKHPPFNTSINKIEVKKTKIGSVIHYMNNPSFSELDWDTVKSIYLNVRYKKPISCLEGNKCEQALLKCANEVFPDSFIFNGNVLGKKIGTFTPDILHVQHPIIIEHCGSIFHANLDKELKRKKVLESKGYHVLLIWDYEEKNRNKIKKQIEEFVNNAI